MGLTFPQRARPGRRLRQERRRHRRAGRPRLRARRDRHGHRRAAARQPEAAAVPAARRPRGRQPDGLQQRRRRGGRPAARCASALAGRRPASTSAPTRCSASTSARPRWCPRTQAVGDYEKRAGLLAPYADYLVVNVSSPNTPGLRDLQAVEKLEPLLTAVRRRADEVTTEPGAAAGQDRARPRRRGRARRRRPGPRPRPRRDHRHQHHDQPRRARHAERARSSDIGAGGLSGRPLTERAPRGAAAAARAGSATTSPWSASAASPPSTTPARGWTPAPPCSRPTPRSSTRARCGRRRIVRGAGDRRDGTLTPRPRARCTSRARCWRQEGRRLPAPDPGRARHRRAVPPRQLRRGLGRPRPHLARRALLDPPGQADRRLRRHPRASSSRPRGTGHRWLASQPPAHQDRGHRTARPAVRAAQGAGRPACWSARGTPPRRCSRSPSGCASAAASVTLLAGRPRRGPPAVGALEARRTARVGHGRHRRRLGRAARRRRRRDRRGPRPAPTPTSCTPPARPPMPARRRGRRRAAGAWSQIALEAPMPCGDRPLPGLPGAGGRRGRRRPARPRLRRRPRLPRRPGPLGRPGGRSMTGLARRQPGAWSPPAAAAPAASSPRSRELAGARRFVTRSITLDPGPAARRPRIVETPGRAGQRRSACRTPASTHFLATELPWLVRAGRAVFVSIAGATLGEYAELARRLGRARASPASRSTCPRPTRPAAGHVRRPRAVPRGQRRRRRTPRPAPATCPCWPSSAPTRSGSSRPPARSPRPAPTPSSSATPCRPRCPTAGRRPERPGDPAARAALRRRGTRRPPGPGAGRGAAASATAADARAFLDAGRHAVQIGTALLHDPTTAAGSRATRRPADAQPRRRRHDRSEPGCAPRCDERGPLCAGIDPHAGAAAGVGPRRRRRPGWSGSR